MRGLRAAAAAIISLLVLCGAAPRHEIHLLPRFTSPIPLPRGFPPPPAPPDNPLTAAKIELGRFLFYDPRLSANGTQSCGSCHQQRLAFCDGRARAVGSTGQEHPRNAMSLVNVAYRTPLTWSDSRVRTLEQQALVPLTNEHPVEMGMAGRLEELPRRLAADAAYRRRFAAAFPDQRAPITVANVARAIASFERALVAADSPYDRLVSHGEANALTPLAWRGLQLFFSARARCSGCHGGVDFATPASGPPVVRGVRIPTLRNVALTAPYMHDGGVAALADVVDHERGFRASAVEKRALVAFLESLTDRGVTQDERFSDPVEKRWVVDPAHSDVGFRVRHLMSHVRGRFDRFSGTITESSVDFAVDVASIDTNQPERDKDLRSAQFFDAETFPRLTFRSTAVKPLSGDRYEVTGDLTIHGVTRRVTVPVAFLGTGRDPYSGAKVGFETTFTIRRGDFGITWNQAVDGGVLVGEEVVVSIAVEAVAQSSGDAARAPHRPARTRAIGTRAGASEPRASASGARTGAIGAREGAIGVRTGPPWARTRATGTRTRASPLDQRGLRL